MKIRINGPREEISEVLYKIRICSLYINTFLVGVKEGKIIVLIRRIMYNKSWNEKVIYIERLVRCVFMRNKKKYRLPIRLRLYIIL